MDFSNNNTNQPPPPQEISWNIETFNFFPGSLVLASRWTGELLFECLCNCMSRHEILILDSIYILG